MSNHFVEFTVEDAVLSWLSELRSAVEHGPEIAPGELHTERIGFGKTVQAKRLRDALTALNPKVPVRLTEE